MKRLKYLKWLLPISGLLVAILGVTLIFASTKNLYALAIFIGIAIMLVGVSDIVSLCRKEKGRRFRLGSGIGSILVGAYTVFGGGIDALAIILPLVFALWIISSCLPRISTALTMRAERSPLWVLMFSFGLLGIVLGGLILFHPRVSSFVVVYSLSFLFISHGINTVILFLKLNRRDEEMIECISR
ncbi:MAG: DUF308 domain-containing protein [Defluviitaleaceae bacterium]|nr:DUF308 domain-containing protein [Defluviitaleaceae bacterium]